MTSSPPLATPVATLVQSKPNLTSS
ncbi:UNVERIFIED_CONTAM: hypothetical protein GTU68_038019 [Idotea baltica]|nr:hypothetical protein [Idotea baltica]